MRPEASEKAGRGFYETAQREGRPDGEAEFFAREMRRLVAEAVQRIMARGGGRSGRA